MMPSRRVFQMTNNFTQRDAATEVGICTVASLQWAKTTLQRGRGLGSYMELGLSDHQMNALMAIWRRNDGDPTEQTKGMGLKIVGGADHAVGQMLDVQRITNLTGPHVCIFWNSHHTMGYRVSTKHGRECEWFDNEDGLWLANNDMDIRTTVLNGFAARGYAPISGMRVVSL